MPRTPRKNPSPRKLLQLSSGEPLQEENSDVKELTGVCVGDTAAVDEDSECMLAATNGSHSECRVYDTAVRDVQSSVQKRAMPGGRHQPSDQISVAGAVGHVKSTRVKRRKTSKYSKRQRKKATTRSKKAAKCLPSDELSDVDENADLHVASDSDESTAGRNVQSIGESDDCHQSVDSRETNDNTVNSPAGSCNIDSITEVGMHNRTASEMHSGAVMMLASTADAIETVEDQGQMVSGQSSSPQETEGDYMPTPQKNQLRCLSEELFSLNQESAHITTHIHRRAGTTPRRDQMHASGSRRSLSTPRKFNILNSNSRSNSRSPRSTPRKTTGGRKTPCKVKFPFSTTPAKSEKEAKKTPSSKKKSPCSSSVLNFPTPSKKQTKRKLYAESPEYGARKPAKVTRSVLILHKKTKYYNIALMQNDRIDHRPKWPYIQTKSCDHVWWPLAE